MCLCACWSAPWPFCWPEGGLWSRAPPLWRALTDTAPQTWDRGVLSGAAALFGELYPWQLGSSYQSMRLELYWHAGCRRPRRGDGGSQCVTLTHCSLCLWARLQTASVSLWNLRKLKRSHKEQQQSCRSVKLRSAFDSVLSAGRKVENTMQRAKGAHTCTRALHHQEPSLSKTNTSPSHHHS